MKSTNKNKKKQYNKPSKTIKVTASVEIIRYYKDQWGIIVCSIDEIEKGWINGNLNKVTFKGEMPCPTVGCMYYINAEYVNDPKWGDQYNITSMFSAITFKEGDKKGEKKFLSSIFTPLQIENMYEALEDPYKVLSDGDSAQLVQVKGCGIKTAVSWIERFQNNVGAAKIFVELDKYNLTNKMIEKLMNRYKSSDIIIEKVEKNPYILCTEVDGIGWKKADKIALDGGIDPLGVERVSAFIYHYLSESGEDGKSWILCDELMGAILDNIGEEVRDLTISEAIQNLSDKLWWNEEKTKIGLKRYFILAENISKELIRIKGAESHFEYENWEEDVKHLEGIQGWEFTNEQKQGVKTVLENNITIITGSAGVGKTATVSAILSVLKNYSFVQTALSGRAASKLSEVTGKEGFTIHRLLGYPTGDSEHQLFVYNQDNQLGADIYILDEISMVSARLFYYLIRAIPSGAKLICLGDMGQLEPIGEGNVAHDLIASGEIPVVTLTKIHRQAAKSAIITESIKIRHGEQIVNKDWAGDETRGELKDLSIHCYSDKSNTFYKIVELFSGLMEKPDFNIMETQVIVPLKQRGDACTYNLNNALQELYNPVREKNPVHYTVFHYGKPMILRVGDKVINTVNNYNTEPAIYNGNIGIIKKFVAAEGESDPFMVVDFLSIGEVMIAKKYWNNIDLAYAITGHKSQGDQYNNVIFGFDYTAYNLLSRELVYTGITRAKKKCDLVAQTSALRFATANQAISKKQTHLRQVLYDTIHPKLVF